VAELHKIIAKLKGALEKHPPDPPSENHVAPAPPEAPIAHRAELVSTFARELERVSGHFLGVLSEKDAAAQVAAIATKSAAKTAAIGEGVVTHMSLFTRALEDAGCSIMKPGATPGEDRAKLIQQLASCDIGVAEAHGAIASSGSLVIVSAPARPSSLTLLPPISVIVVHVDRVVPDLAAALTMVGSDVIAENRMTIITGPSRTADIEKRIVLGVHGPKELIAAIIWPDA
jgi:L-lactate dehydrogenase complex protein LldG